jgi:hypothetical protein
VISKTQSFEHMVKYEFANRNYLINDYTSTNDEQKRIMYEQYEETCFADDKIKNDIEDISNKIKSESAKLINKLGSDKKNAEKMFKNEFNQISNHIKDQEKAVT